MSRDYRKLHVFQEADSLVLDVYRVTSDFPLEERYGLQSQIRRGAVSCVANMVEGSARRSTTDYCRFLEIAHGSAREVGYLLTVARRLQFLREADTAPLERRYDAVQGMLQRLVDSLEAAEKQAKANGKSQPPKRKS